MQSAIRVRLMNCVVDFALSVSSRSSRRASPCCIGRYCQKSSPDPSATPAAMIAQQDSSRQMFGACQKCGKFCSFGLPSPWAEGCDCGSRSRLGAGNLRQRSSTISRIKAPRSSPRARRRECSAPSGAYQHRTGHFDNVLRSLGKATFKKRARAHGQHKRLSAARGPRAPGHGVFVPALRPIVSCGRNARTRSRIIFYRQRHPRACGATSFARQSSHRAVNTP